VRRESEEREMEWRRGVGGEVECGTGLVRGDGGRGEIVGGNEGRKENRGGERSEEWGSRRRGWGVEKKEEKGGC